MRPFLVSIFLALFPIAAAATDGHGAKASCGWACPPAGATAPMPDPIPAQAARSWGNRTIGNNGHAAFVASPDGALRMAFICFGTRGSVLFFSGPSLEGRSASDGQLVMNVDGRAVRLKVTKRDRGFAAPVRKDGPLLAALRAGNNATLMNDGNVVYGRVTLAGSSAAIRTAQSRCGIV